MPTYRADPYSPCRTAAPESRSDLCCPHALGGRAYLGGGNVEQSSLAIEYVFVSGAWIGKHTDADGSAGCGSL